MTSVVAAAVTLLPALPARAAEATYIVNRSESDSARPCRAGGGTCTLRGAIIAANAHAGRDRIAFNVPPGELDSDGNARFWFYPSENEGTVQSSLPKITDPVVIDGTTQPGYEGRPKIWLLGSLEYPGAHTRISAWGLNVETDESLIKGLLISGFFQQIQIWGNRNVVQQNAIGTTGIRFGTGTVIGNIGVEVVGNGNTIGTTATGPTNTGNVISQNSIAAVRVGSAADTRIAGNMIGTDWTGMAAQLAAPSNPVGILLAGAVRTQIHKNVISANTIGIDSPGGVDSHVTANMIGLDARGVAPIPNETGIRFAGRAGDEVKAIPTRAIIGGTQEASRNFIAGNRDHGISIVTQHSELRIIGNTIGLNARDEALSVRQRVGVFNNGPNNAIGMATFGGGNLISGNETGVSLSRGDGVSVAGNRIGTDRAGTSPRPNWATGIFADGSGATIGGLTTLARNIVSGNGHTGVLLGGTSITVQGNFIGTDWSGDRALPNHHGIRLHGSGNLIGGSTHAARNVISGNLVMGMSVEETASANTIRANYVGTNVAGTAAVPNGDRGLFVIGPRNVIARNVISGNGSAGVELVGDASQNRIEGNVIGLVADATRALGNRAGIRIHSPANIVGGGPGRGNVISGNNEEGIQIEGTGASSNQLIGNYIGTNGAGRLPVPNRWGVTVMDAPSTKIGDGGNANVVSGNTEAGIRLLGSGTVGTMISGNGVGTQADGASALGNGDGIVIDGARQTKIGTANVIAFNRGTGVRVLAGEGNSIVGNAIHGNGLLGIDLGVLGVNSNDDGDGDGGANQLQNYPRITSAVPSSDGKTLVSGTLRSTPNTTFQVQIFESSVCDGSSFGEGRVHVATVSITTNSIGRSSFTTTVANVSSGDILTTTATNAGGNTSEYSACLRVA